CLAPDRLMYAEGWYADKTHDEEDIQLGDWIVQRRCPHLRGDLSRFGETSGTTLTCTVHGWQFDLETGHCLSTDDDSYRLRSRPARALAPQDPRAALAAGSTRRTRNGAVARPAARRPRACRRTWPTPRRTRTAAAARSPA